MDKVGRVSLMELSSEDAKMLESIFFQFEVFTQKDQQLAEDNVSLIMFSAKTRFLLAELKNDQKQDNRNGFT